MVDDQQLAALPEHVLFDLARNESASKEWRKAAVALLLEKKSKKAEHPELRELRLELQAEEDAKKEVAAMVASAVHTDEVDLTVIPGPIPVNIPSISEILQVNLSSEKEVSCKQMELPLSTS